jgi:hypothetical protein
MSFALFLDQRKNRNFTYLQAESNFKKGILKKFNSNLACPVNVAIKQAFAKIGIKVASIIL